MIKQLKYSKSVGVPRDQKTAHAALRMFGYFLVEEMARWPERHPPPDPPPKTGPSVDEALKDIFHGD